MQRNWVPDPRFTGGGIMATTSPQAPISKRSCGSWTNCPSKCGIWANTALKPYKGIEERSIKIQEKTDLLYANEYRAKEAEQNRKSQRKEQRERWCIRKWMIDKEAAKVIRRIFALCVDGFGPTQIAKKLKTDKVMTPTEYWNSIGRNCGKPPERPFNWCSATIAD